MKLSATSQYRLQMDFTQRSIQIYKDNPSSVLVTYTEGYKNTVTFTAFTRLNSSPEDLQEQLLHIKFKL